MKETWGRMWAIPGMLKERLDYFLPLGLLLHVRYGSASHVVKENNHLNVGANG